jgi:hypothetical protein
MVTPVAAGPGQLHDALRRELLRLAGQEETAAASEAEGLRYWEAVPVGVVVHRRCAAALRDAADELLVRPPRRLEH